MELITQYKILRHIKYEISGDEGERVLIIPNIDNVPDMKRVLCLSDTSLHIWRMIADQKNCEQIIEEMTIKYNVESKKVEKDVKDFLCTLLEKGYISVTD